MSVPIAQASTISRFPMQLSTPAGDVNMVLVVGLDAARPADAASIAISRWHVDDVSVQPTDDAVLVSGALRGNKDISLFAARDGDHYVGTVQVRRGSGTMAGGSNICLFRVAAVDAMLRRVGADGASTVVLDYPATFADLQVPNLYDGIEAEDALDVLKSFAKNAERQHRAQIETLLKGFRKYVEGIVNGEVSNPLNEIVIVLDEPAHGVWQQSVDGLKAYWQT